MLPVCVSVLLFFCKQTLNLIIVGPVSGQEGPLGGGFSKHLVHRDTQVQVLSNKLKKKWSHFKMQGCVQKVALQWWLCIESHGRRRHGSLSHENSRMVDMCLQV